MACVMIVAWGCLLAPRSAVADWPWNRFTQKAPVGSPEWWKKEKRNAVFEPGKGYKVPGVEGYFDGAGRPMQGPVAIERVVSVGESKDDVGLIPGLDPKSQYDKVKSAVGLGPNEQLARAAYAEGVQLFQEGKYKAAAEKFKTAIARGPHSPVEQHAMFMLAESYFFDNRYIKARDAYDALVKEHSNTRYLDTVVEREWKIAQYWEKYEEYNPDWVLTPNTLDKTRPWFDTIGHAIKTYNNIRLNDPTGPRADDATMAVANIYFRRGRYEDADYHYTLLRREYPRSEWQFEAHLLGLQAKRRKYQGQDYDGKPLEEAKTLVKQLRSQFAGRLSDEQKERLRVEEAQLNMEIATREFRMASYYDNKKDYGAARHYYGRVIQTYPDTELAKQARERVAEIAGEPDRPPKPLAFLVDRLPQSRERARVARIPELQKGATRLAESPQPEKTATGGSSPTATTK
jgi:TolA-binding protein